MKKSTSMLPLLLTLLATIIWFSGSWWYYACRIKNTCGTTALKTTSTTIPPVKIDVAKIKDTDGDGLSDDEEKQLNTDPLLPDTDQDGIADKEEIGSDLESPLDTDNDGIIDALDPDDDNDGLSTLLEGKIGTSVLHVDTDEDGLTDAEEVGKNTDKPLDTDNDGVINALDKDDDDDGIETSQEILLGINPLLADTDGDGLSDAQEIGDLLDKPLDVDSDGTIDALDTEDNLDQDGDGLTDAMEAKLNTDPTKKDTDGDGIDDLKEVGANLDSPLDTDLDGIIDALDTTNDTDTDNDGLTDEQELKLKSNPANVDSDGDGINDNEEVGSNIDQPLDSDDDGILNIVDEDDDNDGLTTRYESQIGTNPLSVDTDGDGINDSKELESAGSDVLWDTDNDGKINPNDPDDDNDSIPTIVENTLGTNPLKADSDGDGISDAEEIGNDINKPLDTDGDGIIDAIDTVNNKTVAVEPATTKKEDNTVNKEKSDSSDANANKTDKPKPDEDNKDSIAIEFTGDAETGSIRPSRLYFPFSSDELKLADDTEEYFSSIVKWMNQSPENIISLTGHTDNIGPSQANLAMGIRRVMVVRELLIEKGAPFQQIEVMSKGESQPIASNATKAGRLKNRRVEISPIN